VKKKQKNEGIDDYYENWFETYLQPVSRMILSAELRRLYVYEFPLFINSKSLSNNNVSENVIYIDKPVQKEKEINEIYLEIIETDISVSITIELIDVLENNIKLEITKNTVKIIAYKRMEKYYKEVYLPCDVDVKSAITVFRNGILDIELKKLNKFFSN
jgi:HSP20 family protein